MSRQNFFLNIGGFVGSFSMDSSGSGGVSDSGNTKTESRASGSFRSLKSQISGKVTVRHGDAAGITVEADENIVPLITSEIINNELTIAAKGSYSTSRPIKISVIVPEGQPLPDLILLGSGDISMHDIDQSLLAVTLSGSGDINLSGRVARVDLTLQGSGDIDARRLKSEEVVVSLMGSGDIEAYATDKATVKLVGSGDVVISGSPKNVSSSSVGSGDVSIR
jgi:Protein of unknown function (DUF2807).